MWKNVAPQQFSGRVHPIWNVSRFCKSFCKTISYKTPNLLHNLINRKQCVVSHEILQFMWIFCSISAKNAFFLQMEITLFFYHANAQNTANWALFVSAKSFTILQKKCFFCIKNEMKREISCRVVFFLCQQTKNHNCDVMKKNILEY